MVKEMSSVNKQKYRFLPYDPKYPSVFLKEKNKIKNSLGENIKIEHVGSTSVPGLGGKGIIDIAIKTPKSKINKFLKRLGELGYEQTPKHPADDRRVFLQKIIKSEKEEKRTHIHLALTDEFWNSFIAVRDYLRDHDIERKKYAKLKKEAVRHAKGEGNKYYSYKEEFLRKLTKEALGKK